MTVTDARAEQVAFISPCMSGVREVVSHTGAPAPASWADLEGSQTYVAAGTSLLSDLPARSAAVVAAGLPAIEAVDGGPWARRGGPARVGALRCPAVHDLRRVAGGHRAERLDGLQAHRNMHLEAEARV
ncbi:MAG: hypothetical protein ACPGPE_16220, partial [Planctomycetota bacterium]